YVEVRQNAGQKRDQNPMMAEDGVAAAAALGVGTFDDIDARAIVIAEVEVDGREFGERAAQVAHGADGLEEDLGKHDGRADIQVDAASVELAQQGAEKTEVVMRGRADGGAGGGGMSVRRVGADGDVDRHG